MKYISQQILKGGANEVVNRINEMSSNRTFVIIICLILAAYSARVAGGYTLPSTLYYLFDNLFAKIITFVLIVFISQFNKSIGIMLILSYVLLMIAYYKQNGVENFEDIIYGIHNRKVIEGFETDKKSTDKDETKDESNETPSLQAMLSGDDDDPDGQLEQ